MEELDENRGINKFVIMMKGTILAMILTLIMIFVLSIILSVSSVKENVIMPTVIFISSFSILMSSFFVAKKFDKNGIVYGSTLGLIYMLVLYFLSSFINFNFSINLNSLVMIAFGVIGGAIGGILGVNLK